MSGVEKFMVEKSGVEKFLLALGLNFLGLKLGVEKSGVEMSFNHFEEPNFILNHFENMYKFSLTFIN